jgi:hypothetical protein
MEEAAEFIPACVAAIDESAATSCGSGKEVQNVLRQGRLSICTRRPWSSPDAYRSRRSLERGRVIDAGPHPGQHLESRDQTRRAKEPSNALGLTPSTAKYASARFVNPIILSFHS